MSHPKCVCRDEAAIPLAPGKWQSTHAGDVQGIICRTYMYLCCRASLVLSVVHVLTSFQVGKLSRSYLSVDAGPSAAAARAMTYLNYGSHGAPYTLAAAGRASGNAAVVHLWDERSSSTPVSRLSCPGGASLVARMEPSKDGSVLLGVVEPGTVSTAAFGVHRGLGSCCTADWARICKGSWRWLTLGLTSGFLKTFNRITTGEMMSTSLDPKSITC